MDNGRLETVPNGTMHLDTVRSLHKTVVSLRTALEISKNELKELKEKYQEHSRCIEYADIIEKLTLENHILRRKIIDSDVVVGDNNNRNTNLDHLYSPKVGNIEESFASEVLIKTATTDNTTESLDPDFSEYKNRSTDKLEEILEESKSESIISDSLPNATSSPIIGDPLSQSISREEKEDNVPSFKTKLELLSKFDVRIKVKTLKEGSIVSSTTSDTDSITDEKKVKTEKSSDSKKTDISFEEHKEHFDNFENPKGDKINIKTVSSENIKMAVPNEAEVKSKTDKFDVQVRITSEDSLVLQDTHERTRRKETMNLDVDNLSLK